MDPNSAAKSLIAMKTALDAQGAEHKASVEKWRAGLGALVDAGVLARDVTYTDAEGAKWRLKGTKGDGWTFARVRKGEWIKTTD